MCGIATVVSSVPDAMSAFEDGEVGGAACAHDQPRAELAARDRQLEISHPAPPSPLPPARRRSARTPIRSRQHRPVDGHRDVFRKPRLSSSPATVVCSSTSTASSLTVTSSACSHCIPSSPRFVRLSTARAGIRCAHAPRLPVCAHRAARRSAARRASSDVDRPRIRRIRTPSAGITAHASSRSSRTPVTAGAVSRPCS